MKSLREKVFKYAKEQYGTEPEYLWADVPTGAVLRHSGDNKKWYSVMMEVEREKLGLEVGGKVDIIDTKCDPLLIGSMILNDGFLPAYNMNKTHWITILLDGSVKMSEIENMLDLSYDLTRKKVKKNDKTRGE
ncbi:MAG: MmcQ/YjbR family DNA-binding protein [Clostridia bacterium]|nr:MmcQ/YjbR family DNA-binding protein [Clostridia bacterium]